MQTEALEGGFANPPADSARAFRAIMTATARPGEICEVIGAKPPAPLSVAAGVTLLTLCDAETPIYLAGDADCKSVRDWVAFHLGAPFAGPSDCTFAVGTWEALLPLKQYPIGTPEYPDRSTTLIAELPRLEVSGSRLTGPGIRDTSMLSIPDPELLAQNSKYFPLGLDFIFTCGARLAGLPRSTRIG